MLILYEAEHFQSDLILSVHLGSLCFYSASFSFKLHSEFAHACNPGFLVLFFGLCMSRCVCDISVHAFCVLVHILELLKRNYASLVTLLLFC